MEQSAPSHPSLYSLSTISSILHESSYIGMKISLVDAFRSSVKKKLSVGSMWGRCRVDVGSMWGRCRVNVGSM